MRYYEKIEADALARNIPVMQREGLEFMIEIFKHHNCHCCLEIGSAIGYSAMMLVSNINNFKVETIELNEERYLEAVKNIEENNLKSQIIIHHGDALSFDLEHLKIKKYDFNQWLKAAGIRAIKTVAQTAVALIGTSTVMNEVNWAMIISASCLSGVVSILTSVAGLPELEEIVDES